VTTQAQGERPTVPSPDEVKDAIARVAATSHALGAATLARLVKDELGIELHNAKDEPRLKLEADAALENVARLFIRLAKAML
jgi:hypothetical protein